MCHVSPVTCHVSHVTCHVTPVPCHFFYTREFHYSIFKTPDLECIFYDTWSSDIFLGTSSICFRFKTKCDAVKNTAYSITSSLHSITLNLDTEPCLLRVQFQNEKNYTLTVTMAFQTLYDDTTFTDVTIACEGNKKIEAHKVILNMCSNLFRNILKDNPKPILFFFIQKKIGEVQHFFEGGLNCFSFLFWLS